VEARTRGERTWVGGEDDDGEIERQEEMGEWMGIDTEGVGDEEERMDLDGNGGWGVYRIDSVKDRYSFFMSGRDVRD